MGKKIFIIPLLYLFFSTSTLFAGLVGTWEAVSFEYGGCYTSCPGQNSCNGSSMFCYMGNVRIRSDNTFIIYATNSSETYTGTYIDHGTAVSVYPDGSGETAYYNYYISGNTMIMTAEDNGVTGTVTFKAAGRTWYYDNDSDGYGNNSISTIADTQPSGYVSNASDCNDYDSTIHPGATEIRGDGIDQDCNGSDLAGLSTYYHDYDGDGYGTPTTTYESDQPLPGYVTNNTDCNDYDNTIHPGATEIRGDGIDQDCNGSDLPALLSQTQVSQLYVSIFGRASEGEGNAYWCANQCNMVTAANTMLATGAAQSYFGATLYDNQAFIEFIYENTLGKTYAEDPDGVNYWVSELATGKSKGQVIATLINAAMDPIYNGLASQNRFINKVTVCNYVANTITTCPDVNDLSDFVCFISSVTHDSSTVTTAMTAVAAFQNPPQTSYVGTWSGTSSGTSSGTWTIYIDNNNNISGTVYWNEYRVYINITGFFDAATSSIQCTGQFTSASFNGTIQFNGQFTSPVTISGTWSNYAYGESGAFIGQKQ